MPFRPLKIDEQKLLRNIVTHCILSPASLKRTRLRCRSCGFSVILSLRGIGAEAMMDHLSDCRKIPSADKSRLT